MSDDSLVVLDTSAAIPLLVASHEAHELVSNWADGRILGLCGQALVESYSVLTRLPGDARVAPADAVTLIDENFSRHAVLSPSSASQLHRELERCGVSGGASYDGLVGLAARENDALLVTRDARARATYDAVGARVHLLG